MVAIFVSCLFVCLFVFLVAVVKSNEISLGGVVFVAAVIVC